MWIFVDFWIIVGFKCKEGKICVSCCDDDFIDGVLSIIGIVLLELIYIDECSGILGKIFWEEFFV